LSRPAAPHRENAARACRLLLDPPQHFSVLHQGFLAEATRHVQNIQRRRIGQGRVRRKPQSFQISNGLCGLAVDTVGRVRDARQHLERSGQIDLIDALEQEGADVQVGVMRDHGHLRVRGQR
jgi:hypothetical protein